MNSEDLKALALDEGFELAGVCRAEPSEHLEFLEGWVAADYHGEMGYLARPDAIHRRGDPRRTLPEARSLLVVGHNYNQEDPAGVPDDPSRGVIARYARGRDYHRVVKKGLMRVHRRVEETLDREIGGRAYVDTGPLLERELGRKAGLGWFGKNTMLLHPKKGSWFFLGSLLLELELEPDPPFERDHCGTCRACLDACPTGALLGRDADGAPVMDARRCISYLTIEHRGAIPEELRPLIGNRIYGCDICQEVCPFNVRFAEEAAEPGYAARGPGERPVGVSALPGEMTVVADVPAETRRAGPAGPRGVRNPAHPGTHAPSLMELIRMTRHDWDAFSRGSAIRRAGYAGFRRNVAVAMGNWLAGVQGDAPVEAVAALREALDDDDALVREHASWALERASP